MDCEIISWLNQNSGSVQAVSTSTLVIITTLYACYTKKMARIMQEDLLLSSRPYFSIEASPRILDSKVFFDAQIINYGKVQGTVQERIIKIGGIEKTNFDQLVVCPGQRFKLALGNLSPIKDCDIAVKINYSAAGNLYSAKYTFKYIADKNEIQYLDNEAT